MRLRQHPLIAFWFCYSCVGFSSDNCAERSSYTPTTCGSDSCRGGLTRDQRVRERRPFSCSPVVNSDGLDSTIEYRVSFIQLVERGVQVRDDCLGIIGYDDQFDIRSLCTACGYLPHIIYACT
jgi:hypothetical protein